MTEKRVFIEHTLIPTWALAQFNYKHSLEMIIVEVKKAYPNIKRIQFLSNAIHNTKNVLDSQKYFFN